MSQKKYGTTKYHLLFSFLKKTSSEVLKNDDCFAVQISDYNKANLYLISRQNDAAETSLYSNQQSAH